MGDEWRDRESGRVGCRGYAAEILLKGLIQRE